MIQEQHQMELVETHDTGEEEWQCLQCKRRFLVQWPPKYKKVIIEAGDEYAIHGGGKGGIVIQSPQISQNDESDIHLSEEWHSAFDELDFGD